MVLSTFVFFFQAEDGIRDVAVTGVQTCALPICLSGFTVRTAMPPPLKFVMRACCSASPAFRVTGRFTGCRKYRRCSRKSNSFERSEEHTSELQSRLHLVCRLLLEKKKITYTISLAVS